MPSLIADGSDANNTRAEEACNKAHSICLLYSRTRSAEKVCPGSFSFAHSSAILPPHLPLSLSTLAIICRKSPAGKPCIFWGYHQFPVDSSWTFSLAKIMFKISAVASVAPYHFDCMFSEWTQYVGIVVDFNMVWFCGGLVA